MIKAKDKVIGRGKLIKRVRRLKKQGKKVVFTNGCFDLLHVGHVRYLNRAKQFGDVLVVGLNTDDSVRKLKGEERPLVAQEERAEVLAGLAAVDYITFFTEETPYNLINELRPDVLVKGADYKVKDIVGNDVVRESGGAIVRIPLAENFSTTGIIRDIVRKYG